MVSANPTGPIVVSAARNGAIGDSLARLLELAGHEVEREYYYNDAGAQMERFRASVEAVRRGEEPPEDGYQGEYVARAGRNSAATRCRRCSSGSRPRSSGSASTSTRGRCRASSRSGCPSCCRGWTPTSGTARSGRARPSTATSRTACCSARRRGEPTYRAADVVYLVDKLERGFDRAIYVLGADHHGTRNWYAAVARMLGYDPERVEVLLYQLVHLTRGGEQAKMSKRRGDVVFLDEFMDEIGVDAARWYLVNRGPDQTIEIDVDLAAERSREEPGLLRPVRPRADRRDPPERRRRGGLGRARSAARGRGARPRQAAAEFPEIVAEAAERRGPARDPDVRDPRRRRLPPLLPPPPRARERGSRRSGSALCRATQTVIARCLDLVGVEAPERM